jgi:PKD repeat protein
VIYASQPFPVYESSTGYTCSPESGPGIQSPNGDVAADVEISPVSHEMNEAITDPEGFAWYDSSYNENGDDCAYIYGSGFGGAAGARYNQTINGGHYFVQEEFSNADYVPNTSGCIQQEELPTATFSVTSASPRAGIPVAFDGSASSDADPNGGGIGSYTWNFGDGSPPEAGAAPSHTYASAASYTVTLAVTDVDGWTSTPTSQMVTVVAPAAGSFASLPPARILDTRSGNGAPAAPVAAGGTVALQVTGRGGVPASGVSAVVLNVTVTQPKAVGFITAYPHGTAKPTASNLNFVAGQTVPNLVVALVGADGGVALYNGSSGTVQLIADVAGYYL